MSLYTDIKERKQKISVLGLSYVRLPLADISKAKELIGYNPQFNLKAGLTEAVD